MSVCEAALAGSAAFAMTEQRTLPLPIDSDHTREQLAQQERELIQQSREIEELRAQLSQKEREAARINEDYSQIKRTAEELRAANEALTFYLNRYKRVKEKILPPGSWRENVVRRLALPLLARREQRARSTGT